MSTTRRARTWSARSATSAASTATSAESAIYPRLAGRKHGRAAIDSILDLGTGTSDLLENAPATRCRASASTSISSTSLSARRARACAAWSATRIAFRSATTRSTSSPRRISFTTSRRRRTSAMLARVRCGWRGAAWSSTTRGATTSPLAVRAAPRRAAPGRTDHPLRRAGLRACAATRRRRRAALARCAGERARRRGRACWPFRFGSLLWKVDVAIIGAGPAGSTLAALLAARGVSVALIDRDAFPRDKLCGEFLSYDALPDPRAPRRPERSTPPARRTIAALPRRRRARTYEFALPHAARGVSRMLLDDLLRADGRAGASGAETATRRRLRSTTASRARSACDRRRVGTLGTIRPAARPRVRPRPRRIATSASSGTTDGDAATRRRSSCTPSAAATSA